MKTKSKRFGLLLLAGIAVVAGCGGGDSSTTRSVSALLTLENEKAARLHAEFSTYEQCVLELNNYIYESGLSREQFTALAGGELKKHLPETVLRNMDYIAKNNCLPAAGSLRKTSGELLRIEKELNAQLPAETRPRLLGAIVVGAAVTYGILSGIDSALDCYEEFQKYYYQCYNTRMNSKCIINGKTSDALCKNTPLASIGIAGNCAVEAAGKVDECKKTAENNAVSAYTAEAAAPFNPAVAGAITLHSTVGSLSNITNNTATILGRWRDGKCSEGEPENRSTDSRIQKQKYFLFAGLNGSFSPVPAGRWDLSVFSEGFIRKEKICVDIKKDQTVSVFLDPVSALAENDEESSSSSAVQNGLDVFIDIPGYTSPLTADKTAFLLENGVPGILAVTFLAADREEIFILKLSPALHAGGQYTSQAFSVGFNSPSLRENDGFIMTSGTLKLNDFGVREGSRISGTFSANVRGINSGLTGNIRGSFNGILHERSYYSAPDVPVTAGFFFGPTVTK